MERVYSTPDAQVELAVMKREWAENSKLTPEQLQEKQKGNRSKITPIPMLYSDALKVGSSDENLTVVKTIDTSQVDNHKKRKTKKKRILNHDIPDTEVSLSSTSEDETQWRRPKKSRRQSVTTKIHNMHISNNYESLMAIDDTESSLHESEEGLSDHDSENEVSEGTEKLALANRRVLRKKSGKRREEPCKKCEDDCIVRNLSDDEQMTKKKHIAHNNHKSIQKEESQESNNENTITTLDRWESKGTVNDNTINLITSDINWFGYSDSKATEHWKATGTDQSDKILSQPFIRMNEISGNGPKFKVILILNSRQSSTIARAVIDSGSFTSTLSEKLCHKLGSEIVDMPPVRARSATGPLTLTQKTTLNVNFGSVSSNIDFSLVNEPAYSKNLILIGSDVLSQLEVTLKFKDEMMLIKDKFPVKLYTKEEESLEKIHRVKGKYVTSDGVDLILPKDITLHAKTIKSINMKLNDRQIQQLLYLPAFARSYRLPEGIVGTDLVIERDFDYKHKPILIKLSNYSDEDVKLYRRQTIYRLKSIYSSLNEDTDSPLAYEEEEEEEESAMNSITLEDDTEGYGINSIVFDDGEEEEEEEDLVMEDDRGIYHEDENTILTIEGQSTNKKRKIEEQEQQDRDCQAVLLPQSQPTPFLRGKSLSEMPLMSKEEITDRLREETGPAVRLGDPLTLPDFLKDKLDIHKYSDDPYTENLTRLVYREMSEDDIKKAESTKSERIAYYDEMGRQSYENGIKYGETLSEDWKQKFNTLLWNHRDTMASNYQHLSAGINTFMAHIAPKRDANFIPARVRQANKFSEAVFQRMISLHTEANIMTISTSQPLNNSFLVQKAVPEAQRCKSVEEIMECTPERLTREWRMVVDLAKMSQQLSSFSSPLLSPRVLLTQVEPTDYLAILDLSNFFSQICVTDQSKHLLTFLGPNCATTYTHNRCPQGLNSSSGLACLISNILFQEFCLLCYVDDLVLTHKSLEGLYDLIEKVLQRARMFNVCFKFKSVTIGFTTRETDIKICGFEIGRSDTIKIPKLKRDSLIKMPRSRKNLITLVNVLSYYNNMNISFSECVTYLKAELERQKNSSKFCYTNRLDQMVFILLNLIKTSPGLKLISDSDYQKSHLLLFTDATLSSVGAILLALLPNRWVIPIGCMSKQARKISKGKCANQMETLACDLALRHFAHILSYRSFFSIMTDSQYVYRLFHSLPLDRVPRRYQSLVLECKSNYHFGILKLSGKENYFSDFMSRFGIHEIGTRPLSHQDSRQLFKFAMKGYRMPEGDRDALVARISRTERDSNWDEKHEEVRDTKMQLPLVFNLENCTIEDEHCHSHADIMNDKDHKEAKETKLKRKQVTKNLVRYGEHRGGIVEGAENKCPRSLHKNEEQTNEQAKNHRGGIVEEVENKCPRSLNNNENKINEQAEKHRGGIVEEAENKCSRFPRRNEHRTNEQASGMDQSKSENKNEFYSREQTDIPNYDASNKQQDRAGACDIDTGSNGCHKLQNGQTRTETDQPVADGQTEMTWSDQKAILANEWQDKTDSQNQRTEKEEERDQQRQEEQMQEDEHNQNQVREQTEVENKLSDIFNEQGKWSWAIEEEKENLAELEKEKVNLQKELALCKLRKEEKRKENTSSAKVEKSKNFILRSYEILKDLKKDIEEEKRAGRKTTEEESIGQDCSRELDKVSKRLEKLNLRVNTPDNPKPSCIKKRDSPPKSVTFWDEDKGEDSLPNHSDKLKKKRKSIHKKENLMINTLTLRDLNIYSDVETLHEVNESMIKQAEEMGHKELSERLKEAKYIIVGPKEKDKKLANTIQNEKGQEGRDLELKLLPGAQICKQKTGNGQNAKSKLADKSGDKIINESGSKSDKKDSDEQNNLKDEQISMNEFETKNILQDQDVPYMPHNMPQNLPQGNSSVFPSIDIADQREIDGRPEAMAADFPLPTEGEASGDEMEITINAKRNRSPDEEYDDGEKRNKERKVLPLEGTPDKDSITRKSKREVKKPNRLIEEDQENIKERTKIKKDKVQDMYYIDERMVKTDCIECPPITLHQNDHLDSIIDMGSYKEIIRCQALMPYENIGEILQRIPDFNTGLIPDRLTYGEENEEEAPCSDPQGSSGTSGVSMRMARSWGASPLGPYSEEQENNILSVDIEKQTMTKEQRIRIEQENDDETRQLIKIVNENIVPTESEIRYQSEYMQRLLRKRTALVVCDGHLYINHYNNFGEKKQLLVIPMSIACKIIREVHEDMAHSNRMTTEATIMKSFFIAGIKRLTREFACAKCIMARVPRKLTTRKLGAKSAIPGNEAHYDLIYLPNSIEGDKIYKFAITIVDSASGFIACRKLETRTAKEVIEQVLDVLYTLSWIPSKVLTDKGVENHNAEMRDALIRHDIEFEYVSPWRKNSLLAECHHARITNTMRKSLDNDNEWSLHLSRYVFALNNSILDYKGIQATPSQLFANRLARNKLPVNLTTDSLSITDFISNINKLRFADHYSLERAIDKRVRYAVGQYVLVLRETIQAIKSSIKHRALKVKNYYSVAKVTEIVDDQQLLLQLKDQSFRCCHVRQVKAIKDTELDEMIRSYEEK